MQSTNPERPVCPGCGDPIGVYESIWRIAPDAEAEQTSWLHLPPLRTALESLWHSTCAEADGVDGG